MKQLILIFSTLFFLSACQPADQTDTQSQTGFSDPDKVNVVVSILPQTEFVRAVGGDNVEVRAMVREGFNPATYEPTPDQLKQVSQADIYFRIGHVAFEQQYMDRIKSVNPNMSVVDTSQDINLRQLQTHSHEEDTALDGHEEEGTDPHIWLSPILVKKQVEQIYQGLVEVDPQNQEIYTQNKQAYFDKLDQLHQELTQTFQPLDGQTIFVYHPSFGYLADQYGLEQEHIEIEGKEPSASEIQRIITQAKQENIKVIFVQQQFSQQAAQAIASEISGSVIELNPLSPNYLDNMRQISQTISENLK